MHYKVFSVNNPRLMTVNNIMPGIFLFRRKTRYTLSLLDNWFDLKIRLTVTSA